MNRLNGNGNRNWVVCICLVMGVACMSALSFMAEFTGEAFAQGDRNNRPELNVFNRYDRPIGAVDADGNVYNPYGKLIGSVDESGTVYSIFQKPLGKVEPNSKVFNLLGTLLGSFDADGNVFNINGRKVGSVKPPIPGNFILIGGAAWLLLLRGR